MTPHVLDAITILVGTGVIAGAGAWADYRADRRIERRRARADWAPWADLARHDRNLMIVPRRTSSPGSPVLHDRVAAAATAPDPWTLSEAPTPVSAGVGDGRGQLDTALIVVRRKTVDLDNEAGRCLMALARHMNPVVRAFYSNVLFPVACHDMWDAACATADRADR